MPDKELNNSEGYEGRMFHPDFQYSFPVASPGEEIYQVLPLIFQNNSHLARPEIFDALSGYDASHIFDFLDISFNPDLYTANHEKIESVQKAYEGVVEPVPLEPESLLFEISRAENDNHTVRFIASACARSMHVDPLNVATGAYLETSCPYLLYYIVTPSTGNMSFAEHAARQFEFQEGAPIEGHPEDVAMMMNGQLFNMIRNYVQASRL